MEPGSREVDLAECTLIYDGVHRHAALLLGVHGEVLDTGVDALALNALYIRSCHFARHIGILREILEVAPAEGAPLDIHAGPEQDIDAHCLCFFSERLTDFHTEVPVPAVRHRSGSREAGRGKGGVEPEVIARAGLSPETVRAVGHDHRRDVQSRDIPGIPLTLSAQKSGFFF